ncbi:MAG: hypothetical protein ACE363_13810 [Alphaproteobacteria bacterium]
MPLDKAIDYTRKVYEGAHRAEIDPETAVQLMGYQGLSGGSRAVLAATRQYGLLEGRGDQIRVSELALRIFEPESREEELSSRSEAALRPDLYFEIIDQFDGEIPSREVIRAFLVRSKGFSSQGAQKFYEVFEKSLADIEIPKRTPQPNQGVVALGPSETVYLPGATSAGHKFVEPALDVDSARHATLDYSAADDVSERLECRISTKAIARVNFSGPVTRQAVEKLIAFLELSKDNFPEA